MKLRLSTCALAALLLLPAVTAADAALVKVGRIVVRADGGFTPQKLPRRAYAPIEFRGHVDVSTADSGPVPAVRRVRLDFDRDGLLTTRGLPVCRPDQIEGALPQTARRTCGAALVGSGHVAAEITLPGLSGVSVRSPVSLFNGPRLNGHPTALAHAYTFIPFPEAYVIAIPIEPRSGGFSYRATIDLPEIAGGAGVLTHIDGTIGRRYRSGGKKRSYVSARCSDNVLETRGQIIFEEGTLIEGSVYRGCIPLPPRRR